MPRVAASMRFHYQCDAHKPVAYRTARADLLEWCRRAFPSGRRRRRGETWTGHRSGRPTTASPLMGRVGLPAGSQGRGPFTTVDPAAQQSAA
jgi:hypothetical protein